MLVGELTVPADSTGVVDISLDTIVSAPGLVQGSVRIAFEELQAEVHATLTARVQDLAVRFSSDAINFGQVALGGSCSKPLYIQNLVGLPLTVKAQIQSPSQEKVFQVQPDSISLAPYGKVSH